MGRREEGVCVQKIEERKGREERKREKREEEKKKRENFVSKNPSQLRERLQILDWKTS